MNIRLLISSLFCFFGVWIFAQSDQNVPWRIESSPTSLNIGYANFEGQLKQSREENTQSIIGFYKSLNQRFNKSIDLNFPGHSALFYFNLNALAPEDSLVLENGAQGEIFINSKIVSSSFYRENLTATILDHYPFGNSSVTISGLTLTPLQTRSKQNDFGDAGACQINVNCAPGEPAADQKNGVARILWVRGNLSGWCTGQLVNNTNYDYTPYFLTAEHCAFSNAGSGTPDFSRWVFYFHYWSDDCSGANSEFQVDFDRVTGAELKARSDDNGGDFGSDFLLLELSGLPNIDPSPYFVGWNLATDPTPQTGYTLHHPSGDILKVSSFIDDTRSGSFGSEVENTHWLVNWHNTADTNSGSTEAGSSGAALFGQRGLIRGILTGGSSGCDNRGGTDFYGRMDYSWTENGSNPINQLRPWLDPGNTGTLILKGSYLNTPPPESDSLDFAAFPVPLPQGEKLSISGLDDPSENHRIQILNTNGGVVVDANAILAVGERLALPTESLSSGIYILRVISSNRTRNQKFMVLKR